VGQYLLLTSAANSKQEVPEAATKELRKITFRMHSMPAMYVSEINHVQNKVNQLHDYERQWVAFVRCFSALAV
jgi:hypothetical protein